MKTINPFPLTLADGRIVVNERCTCGHLRTEHGGLIHHGMCLAGPPMNTRRKLTPLVCRCEKYGFAGHIFGESK